MNLTEIEPPSELIKKALEDGVETTQEYSIWLIGYMSGYKDASSKAVQSISKGGER